MTLMMEIAMIAMNMVILEQFWGGGRGGEERFGVNLESELMENQEEEEADDLIEEIDLSDAEDRTDLAEPHEEAEIIVHVIVIVSYLS